MKSIMEHEATFKNNLDIEVKVIKNNHHEHLLKINNESDMLNSQLNLTSQALRGSPLVVIVHA